MCSNQLFSDSVYAAYKGALKAHIESVPEDERARRWPRKGGGYKIPAREKAEVRFNAMVRAVYLQRGLLLEESGV